MSQSVGCDLVCDLLPAWIHDEHEAEIVRDVSNGDLSREDVSLQGLWKRVDELGLEVQQQGIVRGQCLHVPDHPAVRRDQSRVARFARFDVLKRLSQDLMEKPGALGAGELEFSPTRSVCVEVSSCHRTPNPPAVWPRPPRGYSFPLYARTAQSLQYFRLTLGRHAGDQLGPLRSSPPERVFDRSLQIRELQSGGNRS